MVKLVNAVQAWGSPEFKAVLKQEVQQFDPLLLPLQQGLSQSSHVSDSAISVVVLGVEEASGIIRAKTGIFYAGVIAGSCCSDDPTPMSEQAEYCVVQFDIDMQTAEATVTLLQEE